MCDDKISSYKNLIERSIEFNKEYLTGRKGNVVYLNDNREKRPVVFVGDIHGELDTLERVFDTVKSKFGPESDFRWVFLGDYVDRGSDGFLVILKLMEFQLEQPAGSVVLLRGNHEDVMMNIHDGFLRELYWRFGKEKAAQLYAYIKLWYESLPLVSIIDDFIFAVHGGATIPPLNRKELEELNENDQRWFQLLWNDPDDAEYVYRGGGTKSFTLQDLDIFLFNVGCKAMIRSHQRTPVGWKRFGDKLLSIMTAKYGFVDIPSCIYIWFCDKITPFPEKGLIFLD